MLANELSASAYEWLSRVTYGVNDELTARFTKLGPDDFKRWQAYVQDQLNQTSFLDSAVESRIEKMSLKTLGQNLPQLWTNHFLASRKMSRMTARDSSMPLTSDEEKKSRRARREVALEPVYDLEAASWIRIVYSPFQIFERMVEFWHDHFNIHAYEGRVAPAFLILNRDVIRTHALGNFRQLLGGVCKNPAMLVYLDNAFNQSGNPNENFARELFELHTLGAENYLGTLDRDKVRRDKNNVPEGYVDGDVYEAARAFTGWRVEDGTYGLSANTGQFIYSEMWHDRFQKVILGRKFSEHQPPLKDGEDVLDLLCSHQGTARYIVRKMCRRFISDTPPESLIQSISVSFLKRKDSPTQIRDTLSDILNSQEFISNKSRKFKRPVDYFASLLRSSASTFETTDKFVNSVNRCGHRLFGWKTPDGPPDEATPWQSPQSLIERWKVAQQILSSQIIGCEVELRASKDPVTPEGLASEVGRRLLGPRMSEVLRAQLVQRAAGGRRVDMDLPEQLLPARAVQIAELVVMSPEFQLR